MNNHNISVLSINKHLFLLPREVSWGSGPHPAFSWAAGHGATACGPAAGLRAVPVCSSGAQAEEVEAPQGRS